MRISVVVVTAGEKELVACEENQKKKTEKLRRQVGSFIKLALT